MPSGRTGDACRLMVALTGLPPAMAEMGWFNGRPASVEELRALALSNYGHFTVMVVREGAVQGLDFQLRRLQLGTRILFDAQLDELELRRQMCRAAEDFAAGDSQMRCAMRVTVFWRDFDYKQPLRAATPDVLITLTPVPAMAKPPLRVMSCRFTRPLPQVKHVGTFPQHYWRRQAHRLGEDDALFVDQTGGVSEGSTWNIGFWDGHSVVWPQADALRGSCEHLLHTALADAGTTQQWRPVPLQQAAAFPAAFACNATGVQPVVSINGQPLQAAPALMTHLATLLAAQPWQPLV